MDLAFRRVLADHRTVDRPELTTAFSGHIFQRPHRVGATTSRYPSPDASTRNSRSAQRTRTIAGNVSGTISASVTTRTRTPTRVKATPQVSSSSTRTTSTTGGTVRTRDGRVPERRPESDGAMLGYLAGVLKAPIRTKVETDVRVPLWLCDCPRETRRRWARTYVVVSGVGESGQQGPISASRDDQTRTTSQTRPITERP